MYKCERNTLKFRMLENQVATMKKMRHPHILPLREVVMDPTLPFVFLVSGYVPAVSLHGLLERVGKFDADRSKRFLIQLVDALDYCHTTAGIVHRGLSLRNVFLTETEDVIMAEVGHASLLELGESLAALEFAHYSAPELLVPGSHKTFSSDVWALGVCLYYMMEGAFPFCGTNTEQTDGTISSSSTSRKYATLV